MLGGLTRRALQLGSLSDSQCGYTAISLDILDKLELDSLWPRFGYPNDLLFRVRAARLRIAEVVVRPVYKGEGSELRASHLPRILGIIARSAWRLRRDALLAWIRG